MPYDYSKLLGRIVEKCGTQAQFAKEMGLSERSISVKLGGKRAWKQPEIAMACTVLEIPKSDIPIYFFDLNVQ